MSRIVTFGEVMLRLNPEGYLRLLQATKLETSVAGSEANVSVALANYGMDVSFVTKLPLHEMGQYAVNELRRNGVNIDHIVRDGDRIGVYFVEKGAAQRGSKVIYDRKNSSFATSRADDFDWTEIFKDTEWFHFTGITPALCGDLPAICMEACKAAKHAGLTVSCDLNYRKKLWTCEEAERTMQELMPFVDVCIANESDAADVFGIQAATFEPESGRLREQDYLDVARQLQTRFGFRKVAITLRTSSSANDNDWAGVLYDAETNTAYSSAKYSIHVVDRVGSGDSFVAGLIYAFSNGYSDRKAIEFAVAASCLKQTIEHDFNLSTVQETLSLMNGNTAGRIQR